jgi:serine/threonine protein kinase/Tfp pilus assembly protein PilF
MPSLTLDRLSTALAGRYAVEREIGRGGMATVYLADDLKHHRKVAIKVLRSDVGSILGADRFAREIQIAASLNHPHILPLYDSGACPDDGDAETLLWFSMPFVSGGSLRQSLARQRQLSVDEAIRMTVQVASALDYAHARGLIHRDIKPENILLHEGEAMVTDFGIALMVASEAEQRSGAERFTATGISLGTPQYMSPEQSAGERSLDARSDVYSLGCVLYEILAGEPPYTGPSPQAIMAKRFTDAVPSIRRFRPTVPVAVEQALLKALSLTPADRFATPGDFVRALTAPPGQQSRAPSVAVLPFRNLSTDPENEFFADGITEDVIAQLSKIRSLKVISRSSVMPFKNREQSLSEIGATLQVGTLLEGSVRRAGDRVRIVAQLIDATDDRHVWTETYDRQLNDIFAIQTDVALQIASALEAELSVDERTRIRRKPTHDVRAYQLYLKARHSYNRYTEEGFRTGIEYSRQAIAADPGFALAYTGVGLAYAELASGEGGVIMDPEVAFQEGKKAITKALELDGSLGEAHAVLALLRLVHDHDWAGSEREFRLALELNPGSADAYDHYSWLCAALERFDEALTLVRRAQELDPLAHRADLATTFLRAGRYQEALDEAIRCVEFDPHYARGHSTLGWAYMKNGMVEQGLAELERAREMAPVNTLFMAQLGQAYAISGRTAEATSILEKLEQMAKERYVSPYHFAYVYTGLGDADRAMDYLERAHREKAGSVFGIKGSFLFRSLHQHPRFRALLRKMNLD